jgi:8-hydroxy-5-deazaflavin:NADPH oxidoreductase
MNITIVGTGRVGSTLAKRWLANGHRIIFGTRDPDSEKVRDLLAGLGPDASAKGLAEAAREGDVILLAVPWEAAIDSVCSLGPLKGKVLIDATNPIEMNFDGLQRGLLVGHTSSAAEQIASVVDARVVKAFNQAGTDVMARSDVSESMHAHFVCGDDEKAKQIVVGLAEELKYRVVDVGGLRQARLLEPLGMLWIHLCFLRGHGANFCFNMTNLPK